jgi:hypothetical protein
MLPTAPTATLNKSSAKSPGRGRGRPRKEPNTPSTASVIMSSPGRARGRPRKSDAATISSTKQTPKGNSKTSLKLTDIIGSYELDCEEVEGNWPDAVEDMRISISALPDTKSTLIATFDLGILEGTMILSADKDSLDRARLQLANSDNINADKSPAPALKTRTVYFTWRGRNTGGDDEVHSGSNGTQTGILKFKDNDCSSFTGMGSFPAMGSECIFQGTRLSDEASEEPEPWSNFSEEAYEEANRRRWR